MSLSKGKDTNKCVPQAKHTEAQRKKLLVAALLTEPEAPTTKNATGKKSGCTNENSKKVTDKNITSPKVSMRKKKSDAKGHKAKLKKRRSDPVHYADIEHSNNAEISECLKKRPGKSSLAKKKSSEGPQPVNCSKIVSFVHDEDISEILGEEDSQDLSDEDVDQPRKKISFRAVGQSVKFLMKIKKNKNEQTL